MRFKDCPGHYTSDNRSRYRQTGGGAQWYFHPSRAVLTNLAMVLAPFRQPPPLLYWSMTSVTYLVLWIFGFASFWVGLKLFDDEILLITCALVGSGLVLFGLMMAPPSLQITVEVILVMALFRVCMKCIERGSLP